MFKIFKQKTATIVIIIALLLICTSYVSLVPLAHAAEIDVQDKTLSVLSNVVGINTELYAKSLNSKLANYYIGMPQEEVILSFKSDQSKFRASCCFVNNTLRQIFMSDYEGTASLKQPAANPVDMAKGFLERYQNFANDSFYGKLASMLNTVKATENTTKTGENVQLEVSNFGQAIVDYIWTFRDENGVIAASKNVILSYDGGQLKSFLNNWPLYRMEGTPRISMKDATAIAVEASKTFSYKVTAENGTKTVSGFKIASESLCGQTLSYLNFPDQSCARGGDHSRCTLRGMFR